MFSIGNFVLNSGKLSGFKIECDDLDRNDWFAISAMIVAKTYAFSVVESVPTGGDLFAEALRPWVNPDSPLTLIVDDVFTTGGSIDRQRNGRPTAQQRSGGIRMARPGDVHGIVLFARNWTPDWVDPIFSVMLSRCAKEF